MTATETPFRFAWRSVLAFVFMPALVIAAYWKAGQFDPYTMSFFTKVHVEPTHSMPSDIRVIGWVFVAIGVLLAGFGLDAVRAGKLAWREVCLAIWCSVMVAALGGAFFIAAESAAERIAQEEANK